MERDRVEKRIFISETRKQVILDKCRGICLHCGKKLTIHDNFTVEHIIPLSKGGSNDLINQVSLCRDCNKEKGNDIPLPFFYDKAHKVLFEEICNHISEYMYNVNFLSPDNAAAADSWDFNLHVDNMIGRKLFTNTYKGKVCVVRELSEIQNIKDSYINYLKDQRSKKAAKKLLSNYAIKHKLQRIEYCGKTLAFLDQHVETLGSECGEEYKGFNVIRMTLFTNPEVIATNLTTKMIATALLNQIDIIQFSLQCLKLQGVVAIVFETLDADKYGVKILQNQSFREKFEFHKSTHDDADFTLINSAILVAPEGQQNKTDEEFMQFEKKYRSAFKKRINVE